MGVISNSTLKLFTAILGGPTAYIGIVEFHVMSDVLGEERR